MGLLLAACGQEPGSDLDGDPFVPEPDPDVTPLAIRAIDKIDVLFVLDDSASMSDERAALAEQLPRMVHVLASGDLDSDGTPEFAPPGDVQLGVVSTNLGGAPEVDGCAGLGDDGLLRRAVPGGGAYCDPQPESFLRYDPVREDIGELQGDFSCAAQVGTQGCGFEQPFEAALKALWPGADSRVRFLGAEHETTTPGHGDGANAGFSRADGGSAPSLLVIVLLTDEDDCSVADPTLLLPGSQLSPEDPLLAQGLNVRCALNPDRLYPLARYARALRMLRAGAEQLVMFMAIAGVPPDRVSQPALGGIDYADDVARGAFFQKLLDDPRMQPQIDDNGTSDPGDDGIRSVCEGSGAYATPARRISELAREFGSNGVVQSICQQDFSQTVGFLLHRIAARMRDPG